MMYAFLKEAYFRMKMKKYKNKRNKKRASYLHNFIGDNFSNHL
jgi:hypothetical protein